MFLFELFPDDSPPDGDMTQKLRQAALDLLTPMLGQNLPFISMKAMIDGLSKSNFGITITPALVMDLLDPSKVKAVAKIDGERIYLQQPDVHREVDQDEGEQDKEHVGDMAVNQINQDLKK